MKLLTLCMLVTALCASGATAKDTDVMNELLPTGKLRVALVFAPSMSTFFVLKDENGKARGVTADIADDLGKALNAPVEYVLFPNSGLATDAIEFGRGRRLVHAD